MKRMVVGLLLVGFLFSLQGCGEISSKFSRFTNVIMSSLHLRKECACLTYNETRGMTKEEIKKNLLLKVRREYWDKKSISLLKPSQRKFYSQIGPSILTVQDVRFFNGKRWGEMCVKARVSLDSSVWDKYKPHFYSLGKFCYVNPDVKVEALPERARDSALKALVKKNFPKCADLPLSRIKKAVISWDIENSSFDFNKKAVCFLFKAEMVPVLLSKEKKKVGFLPPPSSQKEVKKKGGVYTLSLKDKQVGDTVSPSLGSYLIVQLGPEGKGISTLQKGGSKVYLHFPCGPSYELKIKMFHNIPLQFGFFTKIFRPFVFMYDNYKKDELQIAMTKKEGEPISTTISMGKNQITLTDFYIAANYNEYKFVKQGKLFKIFCNGKFVSTFFTQGKDLEWVEIRLKRGDILYSATCRSLSTSKK